jgi:hypothetical protein
MQMGKAIESQINALVQDLLSIAEKAAVDAVRSAFNAPTPTHARSTRRRTDARRTSEDIRAMSEQLYVEICRHPGSTMNVFASGLHMTCGDLNLPARMLMREKKIRMTGARSATRYFPIGA